MYTLKTRHEKELIKYLNELDKDHKIRFVYDENTSLCVLYIKGNYYIGSAAKAKKDIYDKKIGRVISLGRAVKNYETGNKAKVNEIPEEYLVK